jgi:glycosyltransferase involved in cell wall biosynthesis
MKISICIPTYNRPDFLKICLESCFHQTLVPYEILIGDDSSNNETESLVNDLKPLSPCPIYYRRNTPALKQAANLHDLIQNSSGDLISIIHDDDLYEHNALEILSTCFANPQIMVSYGKQKIIEHDGTYNHASTLSLNHEFYRESQYAGVQDDFLTSALIQQFPNDGFLIRSSLAKFVGYLEPQTIMGDACDYAFAILCASKAPQGKSYFIDEYTALYRLSNQSIARSNPDNNAAVMAFDYVSKLEQKVLEKPLVSKWLQQKSSYAISQAAKLGLSQKALSWYFSEWYASERLTIRGLKRLASIGIYTAKSRFRNKNKLVVSRSN